jgi:hypothetical protein
VPESDIRDTLARILGEKGNFSAPEKETLIAPRQSVRGELPNMVFRGSMALVAE